MLLDAVVLSLIVGLAAGGRPGRLAALDLRAVWLFVLAAVVRVALDVLGVRGSEQAVRVGPWLSFACYVLLLIAFWLNRRHWPMRVVAAGVLLNLLVVAANGGAMPVDRALAARSAPAQLVKLLDDPRYVVHKPVTDSTRLAVLGDVLPLPMVPFPWPRSHPLRPTYYSPGSIGDVIITLGACALVLVGLGAFGLGRRAPAPVERGSP